MNRLLLICVVFMCYSTVNFGQHFFEVPLSLSVLGTAPTLLDNSVVDFKKGTPAGKSESVTVESYRLNSSFKSGLSLITDVPEITRSEGSNMPIVDLSKGYFSNFLIKEFSKDFRSNMPITELRIPNLNGFPKE